MTSEHRHLSGKLLVATPAIEDGIFRRSVVLVLNHDDTGAQGVVLNAPLGADVDDVLPGWQVHASDPARLFQGGPVQPNSALGLVGIPGDDDPPLGVRRLFGGTGIVDLDAPPAVVGGVSGLRIFAGYAGWSSGQLEEEISEGSWYVVDAESRDSFTDAPESLWASVLRRQSDALALMATYPPDPSWN